MDKHAAYTIVVAYEEGPRPRFVVVRHPQRGWELPGGGLNADEDPVRGAQREFREETGRPLEAARLVLSELRHNGQCHVVTGRAGEELEAPTDASVAEVRLVHHLSQVAPLAFPHDPYERIEKALGTRIF